MTPLFSSQGSASQVSFSEPDADGQIRATQEPQFSATQQGNSTTMTISNLSLTTGSRKRKTDDTVLFAKPKVTGGPSSSPLERRLPAPAPVPASSSSSSSSSTPSTQTPADAILARMPKRFAKANSGSYNSSSSSSQPSSFMDSQKFRNIILLNKKKREAFELKNRQARSNQVILHRKYRAGELPDVGTVAPKDIIVPLQSLAKLDPTVGQLVFATMFKSISSRLRENNRRDAIQDFKQRFNKMLTHTRNNAAFVGSLLRVAMDTEDLNLDGKLIGNAALRSLNYHAGIVLLEKQLLSSMPDPSEGLKKRRKLSRFADSSTDKELDPEWLALLQVLCFTIIFGITYSLFL
jgi:hypothetical protein